MEDKLIFNWAIIFKDGTRAVAIGAELNDACASIGKRREDVAISPRGFLRATPIKCLSTAKVMSEETKAKLKEQKKERHSLRNGGRRKKRR